MKSRRNDIDSLIKRQPWNDLVPHLLRVGANADLAIDRLKAYMRALLEWNRGVSNLISGNDELRFVERHLLESLQPAYWLRESGAERWLDFGSGGGLPAIPLAIAGVGSSWTLVESRRTKTLFLRKMIETMDLHNIEIQNERLENLIAGGAFSNRFDGFTSRATMTLAPTLEMAIKVLKPLGESFLWKGSGREEEMRRDRTWEQQWQLDGLLGIGSGLNVVCRLKRRT